MTISPAHSSPLDTAAAPDTDGEHARAAVPAPPRCRASRGQSTAEYALVLLGAATVALVFIAWAGSTGRIGALFDAVLDTVIGKI